MTLEIIKSIQIQEFVYVSLVTIFTAILFFTMITLLNRVINKFTEMLIKVKRRKHK